MIRMLCERTFHLMMILRFRNEHRRMILNLIKIYLSKSKHKISQKNRQKLSKNFYFRLKSHEIFTAEKWLIWRAIQSLKSERWVTLLNSANLWINYFEDFLQKYWNISDKKHFKQMTEITYTVFNHYKSSENAAEIVKNICVFWNTYK